jgi:hypothetical protein
VKVPVTHSAKDQQLLPGVLLPLKLEFPAPAPAPGVLPSIGCPLGLLEYRGGDRTILAPSCHDPKDRDQGLTLQPGAGSL